MAKYFLGSVGKAEAFRYDPVTKKLKIAFVSKTLTDSGINISTTKDDIRGGQGAPIQFSFTHDSSAEITLTDIQWKKEYLEAQLGANFSEENSAEAYKYHNGGIALEITANGIAIPDAKELPGFMCEGTSKIAWACKAGDDEWFILDYDGSVFKLPNGRTIGAKYCVRYFGEVEGARVAEITSMIIPSELHLIITAPVFAGDACAASRGKAAGELQFDIPRFLLNGGQDFAMNMSSNQTMSLSGVALASESAQCDANGGTLLYVREVISGRKWYEGVNSLIFDEEKCIAGTVLDVYGVTDKGLVTGDPKDLEYRLSSATTGDFTPMTDGKIATAGTYTIRIKNKPDVYDEAVIIRAAA